MRLTHDLESVAGVRRAAAMMGTPQNRALLDAAGLLTDEGDLAAPADLLIAVIADDEAGAEAAPGAAETAVTRAPGAAGGAAERALAPPAAGAARAAERPRTLRSALTALPEATLALI